MNIYQKLNAARETFHAIKLEKSGHNKFAGYYYFELGDFLPHALKVLKAQNLTAVVSFETSIATMRIIDCDKPDDVITITSPMGSASLKGCHEVQNIGAVETYQRRYLWVTALEIVEHDALDASEPIDPANLAITAIKNAQNLTDLKNQFTASVRLNGEIAKVTEAKDKRKKELEGVAA